MGDHAADAPGPSRREGASPSGPWHVAVLMGGWSAERSVVSHPARAWRRRWEERGHTVTRIDMGRDVAQRLAEAAPDVVFNALHGVPGEDGTVQGMMDLMVLLQMHSGLATSVNADRQAAHQTGAGAAWHPDARRAHHRQQRKPLRRRPVAAPQCAEARERGQLGWCCHLLRRRAISAAPSRETAKGRGSISRRCWPSRIFAGGS